MAEKTEKKNKKKPNELDELSLDELIERCKQIKELLANLENQYRGAEISEQSYKQTKEANTKKLNEVRKRLEEWGVSDTDAPPAASSPADKTAQPKSSSRVPAPNTAASATAIKAPSAPAPLASPVPLPSASPAPAITPEPQVEAEKETSPPSPTPSASGLSFAQKIKQLIPSREPPIPRQSEDSAYQPQMQSSLSPNVQLEMQKFSEKFNVELERIKATIDALKETRTSADERMHLLTEGLAELRSNVFQREAGIKEQEMKLAKMKEAVDEIEPQRISKEFSKRDKIFSDIEVRVEKLEVKVSDMIKSIGEINALLKSIGGLENVADMDHEVANKLAKVEDISKATERLSSRIEKIFVDLNKRLEKFNIYEARQDSINEIVNDMIRNFDALTLKFESYAEKKDITTAKEDIADMQKKLDEMKKALKRAVPLVDAELPESLQALLNEKDDVESLLSSVEYEHEKKQISDAEYASIKEKNAARLKELKEKIREEMKKIAPPPEGEKSGQPAEKKAPLVDAMLSDMKDQKVPPKEPDTESEGAKKELPKDKSGAAENAKEESTASGQDEASAPKTGQAEAGASKAKNHPAAEQKNDHAAKNGRKSLRPSQGLFVPAKEITSVKGMISRESQKSAPEIKADIAPQKKEREAKEAGRGIEEKQKSEGNPLLLELEESLREGLITKETYENTKKLLMMG